MTGTTAPPTATTRGAVHAGVERASPGGKRGRARLWLGATDLGLVAARGGEPATAVEVDALLAASDLRAAGEDGDRDLVAVDLEEHAAVDLDGAVADHDRDAAPLDEELAGGEGERLLPGHASARTEQEQTRVGHQSSTAGRGAISNINIQRKTLQL